MIREGIFRAVRVNKLGFRNRMAFVRTTILSMRYVKVEGKESVR